MLLLLLLLPVLSSCSWPKQETTMGQLRTLLM
ncbi:hypothetical protein NC653_002443 [Populus alba x Populus x berolinensis]|uniref:Uncharacterized protein n=1 Tax=Populus alba x Populus x berolinensis TaxID=444605 RepID=A0AAD6RNW4_9ROSI|nr:hypothetical protein NC653_002443 [Populus alba x Populus x berolinensis]